jgi:hypothetical protein
MRSLLVATLLVVACSSSPKPSTPPDNQGGGSGEPSTSHTSCTADADCVVVETACCDHCNGGKAEAFNTAFAESHKPTGCENTACTKMACGAATASCDAGTCKVTIQPL